MSGREAFEALVGHPFAMGLGVQVGELLALADEGRTPMVADPSRPGSAAVRAQSLVDLHAAQIGRQVLLAFVGGDPASPVILGVLRGAVEPSEQPRSAQVDADDERIVVTAEKQLVLRCGKASITLTREGKVLIEGAYLLSRSTGVNRVKGGSVQLN